MGASAADCISQGAKSTPELLNHEEHNYEIQSARQERTADDFRRRVGDGDQQRLKRRKSMRPTARQAETSLTQRISTLMARARNSWVSSCRAIARASF